MNYFSKAILSVGLILTGSTLHAQLSGTLIIPSATYPTLASVITALNTQGVGVGGVNINITAGNPETAPAGGFVLGSPALSASTSATKTISINGSGNTITANTGTSLTTDGIFIIQGVDYLTIDALNLAENAANTTPTTQMEWGFALVKRNAVAPFDGCQNVTIQNCNVTLNRNNTASIGIYAGNHIATNTTSLAITVSADANSNIKCYRNTIRNCYNGIAFYGSATAGTPQDLNNEIGSSLTTGNTIQNFGGGTVFQCGILMNNQADLNITGNIIDNMASGGVAGGNGILSGIYYSATRFIAVQNNNITLQQGTTGNTSVVSAIHDSSEPSSVGATNILGNTISGSGGGTGAWNGIELLGGNLTVNIATNNFRDINLSTTAAVHLIHQFQTATPSGTININGNTMSGTATPYFQKTGAGNNFAFYYNAITGGNTITNVTNNTISQVSLTGGTTFYGIYAFDATTAAIKAITGNTISNITGGTSAMYPVTAANSQASIVHSNTISNVSGGGIIYTINLAGNVSANVYKNKVTGINGVSSNATVYGIYCNSASGTFSLYNNFLTDLTAPATSSNTGVNGIYGAAGTVNAYQNTIVLGKTAAITGGANFSCAGIYSSSPLTLQNNIIYVNATPTGTGIAACIKRNTVTNPIGTPPATTAFTANNNVYYISTSGQSYIYVEGITVAAAKNGYSLNSLTPNTTNNIVNDPAFNKACSAYKSFMSANGENNSFFEDNIVSLGAGTYAPSGTSYAESGGTTAAADDYAGTTRSTPPDIGALQFTGTIKPMNSVAIAHTPFASLNACTPPVLEANITATGSTINTTGAPPRVYYKKTTENNVFGNYPADNVSTFNGWKYTATTGGTAPNFTFIIDYSKLTGAAAANDTIQYFFVAEDNETIPNVGMNIAAFSTAYCLAGVNIPPAAGAIAATPATNRYYLLPPPIITASISDTICRNAIHQMTVTIPAGTFTNATWTPLVNLYTDAAATIPYTGGHATTLYVKSAVAGIYNYSVTASGTAITCTSIAAGIVDVRGVDTAITGNLVFCAGDSTTLSAAVHTGYTYQWLANGTPIAGATSATYTVHTAGSYTVALNDGNSCPDTSRARTVVVNPLPVPVISYAAGVLSTGTFSTYEWKLNDTVIAGATTQNHTPVRNGSYTVTVTDGNGCKGTSVLFSVTDINPGSVPGIGNHPGIAIYPNPASKEIQVKTATPVNITISGMDGKLLLESTSERINIAGLANGVYLIRITDKNGTLIGMEKLLKTD